MKVNKVFLTLLYFFVMNRFIYGSNNDFTVSIALCNHHDLCQIIRIASSAGNIFKTLNKQLKNKPKENETRLINADYKIIIQDQVWDEFCTYKLHGPLINLIKNDTLKSLPVIKVSRKVLSFCWIGENEYFAIAENEKLKIIDLKNDKTIFNEDIGYRIVDIQWNNEKQLLMALCSESIIGKMPIELLKLVSGHPVLYFNFNLLLLNKEGNKIKKIPIAKHLSEEEASTALFVD